MRILSYLLPSDAPATTVQQFLKKQGYSRRIMIRLKDAPDYLQKNGTHVRLVDPLLPGDRLTVKLAVTPSHFTANHALHA